MASPLRRLLDAVARGLENFADTVRDIAAPAEEGETPRTTRTRRRAIRRERRRTRAEADRRARMSPVERVVAETHDWIAEVRTTTPGAPPPSPFPADEDEESPPDLFGGRIYADEREGPETLRGNVAVAEERWQRHTYADVDAALAAYDSLLDAGVPAHLMAVRYIPGRGYVLYVGSS